MESARRAFLASGEGWTLRVRRCSDGTANVTVTAASDEVARRVLAEATTGAVEPVPPDEDAVNVRLWQLDRRRARSTSRRIEILPWPRIRPDYSRHVADAFDRVTDLSSERVTGRLLLLHGPAGTGETTALRALARSWRHWCRLDYALDPERILAEPSYLMGLALGRDGDDEDDGEDDGGGDGGGGQGRGGGPGRWRLLVLEDCDELVRADAKLQSGQALARLLNLTDGMVGQGLDLILAVTTNEPLAGVHPAVVRPGRCLAQIEVGRLSPAEARAWLGRPAAVGPEGATLAELYALRGELSLVRHEERPAGRTCRGTAWPLPALRLPSPGPPRR